MVIENLISFQKITSPVPQWCAPGIEILISLSFLISENNEQLFNPWCPSGVLLECIRRKCNCDEEGKCEKFKFPFPLALKDQTKKNCTFIIHNNGMMSSNPSPKWFLYLERVNITPHNYLPGQATSKPRRQYISSDHL